MLKAIKIRLYPTKTQQITINKLLGCCRLVYNLCLENRNRVYEETKESGSLSMSYKYFCELKEMEKQASKAGSELLLNGHNHSMNMAGICVRRKPARVASDGENEHLAPIIEMGNRSCGDY